jgi:hypothetical protein
LDEALRTSVAWHKRRRLAQRRQQPRPREKVGLTSEIAAAPVLVFVRGSKRIGAVAAATNQSVGDAVLLEAEENGRNIEKP